MADLENNCTSVTPTAMNELPIIRGACGHDCPDTCVWQVSVLDGRAVGLAGDPDHPFTRGVLCAKVNSYLESRVYHPDRVLHPLRRVGAKGEGRFERVSWDDALSDIAARWQRIMAESGAEAIVPYSLAGNQGLIQFASLDRRLFGTLGFSQLERNLCGVVASAGLTATQGTPIGIDPEDLEYSRLILLWGTNTLVTNQHLWPVITRARKAGARVVVIDPVRTRTAEAADWHVAPRPATDAALALGIMHVLVRDGLIDEDYVARYASGFAELCQQLEAFPPSRVASITGLAAGDIEQLAREYGTIRPAVVRPLIGPEHHRNGAMIFRTLACLPVLIGAWRWRGGGLCRSTGALQFSTLNTDALYRPDLQRRDARTLNMRDLGRDLVSQRLSPPIRSLCVYNSNPALTTPNQKLVREGLRREDLFTIVHDLFVTETARYADYVLPATSQLEHLDLVPAWGHLYLALNRPAIEPCGEAVANTELFRRLARALGLVDERFLQDDESLLRAALDSGHPYLKGITYERLWSDGYARLATPQDWRPFAEGAFPTSSGKAQLVAPSLAQLGLEALPVPGELPQPTSRFPLQLITGKSLYALNSSYAYSALHRRRAGELSIHVHPVDAEARQINAGQQVTVYNEHARLTAVCVVTDAVLPGVVAMPFGGSSDAAGLSHSVNQLTPEEPTDWGGGSGFYDAFVEIARP